MAGGWLTSDFAVVVNLAMTESWTKRRLPHGPSWPPYPFAVAGSGDRGGGDGHRGGGVCVRRQWCPSAVHRIIGERVNGHEEIAVPPVGSSAAVADSAACVTSTCGGGGGGRRPNDVNN